MPEAVWAGDPEAGACAHLFQEVGILRCMPFGIIAELEIDGL
jgi:hypothetical protein